MEHRAFSLSSSLALVLIRRHKSEEGVQLGPVDCGRAEISLLTPRSNIAGLSFIDLLAAGVAHTSPLTTIMSLDLALPSGMLPDEACT